MYRYIFVWGGTPPHLKGVVITEHSINLVIHEKLPRGCRVAAAAPLAFQFYWD